MVVVIVVAINVVVVFVVVIAVVFSVRKLETKLTFSSFGETWTEVERFWFFLDLEPRLTA